MGQEIRNEDGRVLGYFLTEAEYTRLMADHARAEFDRLAAEDAARGVVRKWDGTNGRTTAEVLALFRRLDETPGTGRWTTPSSG